MGDGGLAADARADDVEGAQAEGQLGDDETGRVLDHVAAGLDQKTVRDHARGGTE